MAGSMRMARLAGNQHAIPAVTKTKAATAATRCTSRGARPQILLRATFNSRNVATDPIEAPSVTHANPRPKTWPATADGDAPNAIGFLTRA